MEDFRHQRQDVAREIARHAIQNLIVCFRFLHICRLGLPRHNLQRGSVEMEATSKTVGSESKSFFPSREELRRKWRLLVGSVVGMVGAVAALSYWYHIESQWQDSLRESRKHVFELEEDLPSKSAVAINDEL